MEQMTERIVSAERVEDLIAVFGSFDENIKQIEAALDKDVVKQQLALLQMRNTCKAFAFDAAFAIAQPDKHILEMSWSKDGAKATLRADLTTFAFEIEADMPQGKFSFKQ